MEKIVHPNIEAAKEKDILKSGKNKIEGTPILKLAVVKR